MKKGFVFEFSLGSYYTGETRYTDSLGYYWKRVTIYPISAVEVMGKLTTDDLKLRDKQVLARVDLNVPLNEKCEVTDATPIAEVLSTIKNF